MGSRRIKRDYSKKKYNNTLFNKRKTALRRKKRALKIKFFLFTLLGLIIVAGISYIFYGSYLRVINIEVTGSNEISSEEIITFTDNQLNSSYIIPRYNYFLIGDKLSENVKSFFYFKDVKLTKEFPNKILLEVLEREPKFILTIDDKNYLLDDQGTTMGPMDQEKQEKFPDLLRIISNNTINKDSLNISNTQAINNEEIFFIYKISNFLDKKEFIIDRFEKNEFNELVVILDTNIKIFFDTEEKINNQLDKLTSIIDKIGEAKEYIDVRFSDKVYYK